MVDLGSVSTSKELMIPEPMKIVVGNTYDFLYGGRIIQVKLKKIVTDAQNQVQGVIVTKSVDKGLLRHLRDEAITISVADIKQRLLQGGLKEAIII